jgi:hypothetical protein
MSASVATGSDNRRNMNGPSDDESAPRNGGRRCHDTECRPLSRCLDEIAKMEE